MLVRRKMLGGGTAFGLVTAKPHASEVQAAPSLLRGTINGSLWPGVIRGTVQAPEQRGANLKALQDAVQHAAENRRFFELEPGLYEIEGSSGLRIPPTKDGFVWRGSKGTILEQFANNSPILTIGDVIGSKETENLDLSGLRVFYHKDQSGEQNASALQIGLLRNSSIAQLSVMAPYGQHGPTRKAFRGIHVTNQSQIMGFFSNNISDIFVGGAEFSLFDISLVGTGSVFSNIYLTQGVTGAPAPIVGSPLRIVGAADLYESVFEQTNIEWCVTNSAISAQSCRSTTFLSTHCEGNRLIGRMPAVMNVADSEVNLIGFNILDQEIHDGDLQGDAAVFRCYGDVSICGKTIRIAWSGHGKVDRKLRLLSVDSTSSTNAQVSITVDNLTTHDVVGDNLPHFVPDDSTTAIDLPLAGTVERFSSGGPFLETVGLRTKLNVNAIVFGRHRSPVLIYPATLGQARIVTISDRMHGSGLGAAMPVAAGAIVGVRRAAGQGDAHRLEVRNHDGRPIAHIAVADGGQTAWFRFDGSNWRAVQNG